MNYEDRRGGEECVSQLPRPGGGIKIQRRRQLVQKKRTRVKLPKLCREECPECEGLNIFFDGRTIVECHNCQYVIAKGGDSVALEEDGCEGEQDVELFFKKLNIY